MKTIITKDKKFIFTEEEVKVGLKDYLRKIGETVPTDRAEHLAVSYGGVYPPIYTLSFTTQSETGE